MFLTINLSKQIKPHTSMFRFYFMKNVFLVKIEYFSFFVKHSNVLDLGSNVHKKNIF